MDLFDTCLIAAMTAALFSMLAAEKIWPAREFPTYRHWIGIGIAVMVAFVALANGWALLLPTEWLHKRRLLHCEFLGIAGAVPIWYALNTFATYWYHRAEHRFSIAWRLLHQVHHGVPRVDIPSALMAHPLDVVASTTLSTFLTAFVLGLEPRAVALTSVLQFFMALFPHWNVHTPEWVGHFIQRPEEHVLHHERGVHAGNYADWPFWDKLFGTYRAPLERAVTVGFNRAALTEHLKMLAFVDVSAAN